MKQRTHRKAGARWGRALLHRGLGRRVAAAVATVALITAWGTAVGGAASKSPSAHKDKVSGGVVTDAEPLGEPPNYLFPIVTDNVTTFTNDEIAGLLWKGLYTFDANTPEIDYAQSIGDVPVFSDGDKVVTITMKHHVWSNGNPVTARDVEFDLNMIRAVGPLWAGHVTGGFPANVKSFDVVGTYEFRLDLTRAFSPTWFDDDQLTDLVPLPQTTWDKTSATGPVGNYDLTAAGAKSVYKFLNGQAEHPATYTTNPLWKVVDGAWTLSTFGGASSPTVFVPNTKYSGHHATISKFELVPYTAGSAEMNALRSGPNDLSIGTIPTNDIPEAKVVAAEGYTEYQEDSYIVNYIVINFTNPKLAPLFDQLYIRQTLQHLVDQKTDIASFQHGLGAPDYGPTPAEPRNSPFTSSDEKTNPYPYSVADAVKLLKKHGWTVNKGGTDVCAAGGAGAGHCGAGVTAGEKLSIPMVVASGTTALTEETENFASDAAKAGVTIGLQSVPFNTSIAIMNPCTKKHPSAVTCKWGIGTYGGTTLSGFPTAARFFEPDGSDNTGGYDNPSLTKLISKIDYSTSVANYKRVANYGATYLPMLWFPSPGAVSILEVNKELHTLPGTTAFNSEFGSLTPEDWYFTNS